MIKRLWQSKTKRIEIRWAKNADADDYRCLKSNDVIEFHSQSLGIFYTKVKEVNCYASLDELFFMEGARYIISSTDNIRQNIHQIKDDIVSNKIYAIHLEYLYSENTVWEELYVKAKNVINPRDVSGMISAGGVGAAILTRNHNIYTGVCIDIASTLGMCGERNAIANMITNRENEITKLVCVDSRGNVGSPCGACREYLMQLDRNNPNIEILKNEKTEETVRLKDLIPDWWGSDRVIPK